MKEINLRDFYPWYKEDIIIEVTEEVAEELLAGQRYIKASRRRVYRNKAHYSLDAEDGIEYFACFSNPSPQELIERMERFEQLCHALNSLPDAQGQRVFEHYQDLWEVIDTPLLVPATPKPGLCTGRFGNVRVFQKSGCGGS